MTRPILYISPGLFNFGGIARYGQHQVTTLREIIGPDNVSVTSMQSPRNDDMWPDFPVDAVGVPDAGIFQKMRFVQECHALSRSGALVWSGHVNYAHVAVLLAKRVGGIPVVNLYGREVWSGLSRVIKTAIRHCWVVSDCYSTLDHAVGMGIASPARSAVIWDPVDTSRFTPGSCSQNVLRRYGLSEACTFRVMFLARLQHATWYKGADRLIRAFSQAGLPAGSELVIAGDGDALDQLRQLAKQCGISRRTVFTGRVSEQDLPDIYRAASVFVLVSQKTRLAGEGVPLTPLEASACGVPLIVGVEDGSREAISPGETGFFVSARESTSLSAALEALGHNPAMQTRMGMAAARYVRSNFALPGFYRRHADFLGRLDPQPDHATESVLRGRRKRATTAADDR